MDGVENFLPFELPTTLAFFISAAGFTGLALLFCLLHLVLSPFARPRPPALWLLAERACEELVRRLNKKGRSARELKVRAFFLTLAMAAFGLLIGIAAHRIALYPLGWVTSLLLLCATVSAMGPVRLLQRAARAEAPIDRATISSLLRPIVRDSFDHADAHTLARRTLETGVIGLNLFFVMPLFWFLLGGAPAMMVVVMVSALAVAAEDAAEGERQPFVRVVRAISGWFEIIPAWITGLFVSLAALFVSRATPRKALTVMLSQARTFRPSRQGVPVAALAGALGVTLGGPRRHENGHTVAHGWVGAKGTSARVPRGDLQRAALLQMVVFMLAMVAIALVLAIPARFV